MSSPINIEIAISKPILLELEVDPGYVVIPSYHINPEPLFTGSEAFKLQPGDKSRIDDSLSVSMRLSEFISEQAKHDARENLNLNIIDGGTFY